MMISHSDEEEFASFLTHSSHKVSVYPLRSNENEN